MCCYKFSDRAAKSPASVKQGSRGPNLPKRLRKVLASRLVQPNMLISVMLTIDLERYQARKELIERDFAKGVIAEMRFLKEALKRFS